MAAEITFYESDGTTEITGGAINFGVVPVGTTTATTTVILRNTGDATAYDVAVRITQASVLDGEMIGDVDSTPITDTFVTVAASLAVNGTVTVELQWTVPAGATPVASDSAVLEVAFY